MSDCPRLCVRAGRPHRFHYPPRSVRKAARETAFPLLRMGQSPRAVADAIAPHVGWRYNETTLWMWQHEAKAGGTP